MPPETPAPRPEETPESPPVQSSSELRRLVKECRFYFYERDASQSDELSTQRADRRPLWLTIVGRLSQMFGQSVRIVGDAIVGLFLAAVRVMLSGLPSGSTVSRIARSRLVWTITAGCTIAIVAVAIHHAFTQQRRQAATLNQLAAQFRKLRTNSADEVAWSQFTARARARLDDLIPELEEAATADDRLSIDLLWAARDYFPQMLTDARTAPCDAERRFEVCMRRVRRMLENSRP